MAVTPKDCRTHHGLAERANAQVAALIELNVTKSSWTGRRQP
ncbi:MAG: hypothetical protein ACRDTF_24895 [Pseudonocardiaceae bacterium]